MARYKEIKERIQNHYSELPKNLKIVANYFIENFDKIPFLSVQHISEATSLSVASVVRFTQRIGFKGFLEMRDEIANELQEHIKSKAIFSLVDDSKIKEDTVTSVANQDIKNINDTLNHLDRESFQKSIKHIIDAERVYTMGLGVSYLLAEILSYQLNQVAVNSKNFTHNYTSFMEQVLFLNKNDVIIAFSFPPYSKETIETVKFAKEKKCKVISITNKETAPIIQFSDAHLTVKSENMLFTNSFSAISVLINAITTECALKNKKKAKKMLDDLNKVVDKQKLVITENSNYTGEQK